MKTMSHEGYIAEIDIDEDASLLYGLVINTKATLHFAGKSLPELKEAFADTIAEYKAQCAADGEEPERPYSGTLSLRIPPSLHQRVALYAAKKGKSINAAIGDVLEGVV